MPLHCRNHETRSWFCFALLCFVVSVVVTLPGLFTWRICSYHFGYFHWHSVTMKWIEKIWADTQSHDPSITWWRHQMETFSTLLAMRAVNSPVPGEFPAQRPVSRSFDVFFELHLNTRLSKQSWGWWFETLRAYYDVIVMSRIVLKIY